MKGIKRLTFSLVLQIINTLLLIYLVIAVIILIGCVVDLGKKKSEDMYAKWEILGTLSDIKGVLYPKDDPVLLRGLKAEEEKK